MGDVYDKRAEDATTARPRVQEAAAFVARSLALNGLSDPAYVANVLEEELQRFENYPDAEILDMPWQGEDIATGMTMDRLLELADFRPPAGASPAAVRAAMATAIRIVRVYPRSDEIVDFLENAPYMITRILSADTWLRETANVEDALRKIQAHRRALGMGPLDTAGARWTEQDVIDEAQRIARLPNPRQDLKHTLM